MQPSKMHFKPRDYCKPFKLISKCYIYNAVKLLEKHLRPRELKWFREHEQFRHFFHMHAPRSHHLMGMWMLLLRVTCSEKRDEYWFVVNGVPIRYSLREMALISGLNCCTYPENYQSLGGNLFRDMHFSPDQSVSHADVEAKLMSMTHPSEDRLKMAILYFLSAVIVGKKKSGAYASAVEPFFMRAVNDLKLCETFPWGRYAFEANMKDIAHLIKKSKGNVGTSWVFPSFVIPLELLAFETIPCLMQKYCEPCPNVDVECPRMCKMKFTSRTGLPMSDIYETLGETKEIHSVIKTTSVEELLLADILEEDMEDNDDLIIDGWKKILRKGNKSLWFESLYIEDISNRGVFVEQVVPPPLSLNHHIPPPPGLTLHGLFDTLNGLKVQMEDGFKGIHQKLEAVTTRLRSVEEVVDMGMPNGVEVVEEEGQEEEGQEEDALVNGVEVVGEEGQEEEVQVNGVEVVGEEGQEEEVQVNGVEVVGEEAEEEEVLEEVAQEEEAQEESVNDVEEEEEAQEESVNDVEEEEDAQEEEAQEEVEEEIVMWKPTDPSTVEMNVDNGLLKRTYMRKNKRIPTSSPPLTRLRLLKKGKKE